MPKNKLQKILEDLGLSVNEAHVYLAALSLGPSTVLKIARAAGIKRPTAYPVLEALQQRGLITIEVHGFKNLYVAENPKQLEITLEQKKESLQDVLPEFSALYNLSGDQNLLQYHKGLNGLKVVHEKLLQDIKPHEKYMMIGTQESWYDLDPQYFQKLIERRAKLSIDTRLLLQDSPLTRKHKEFEKNYNEKIKILPKDTNLTVNMIITPQRVVFPQVVPPIGAIVIENKHVVHTLQAIFELTWQSLPEQQN